MASFMQCARRALNAFISGHSFPHDGIFYAKMLIGNDKKVTESCSSAILFSLKMR